MSEDLRSTIEAAMETPAPTQTNDPAPAPAPAPVESAPEGLKSAPEAAEAAPVEGEPTPTPDQSPTAPESEANQAPAQDDPWKKPPQSWKPLVREKWAGLPPEVKAEIVRREKQIEGGLKEASHARQFAEQFSEVVKPFASRYAATQTPPLQVVQNLMRADYILSTAPAVARAQYMAKMIQDYGVDIAALDQALSGQTPTEPQGQPPNIQPQIEQLLNQRLAPIQQFLQQQQQNEQKKVQTTIEQMANNPTKYPHFDDVREDMADLIEISSRRGVYLSLDQAYTRAVASNPELSELNRLRQSTSKADKALAASVSVPSKPTGSVTPSDPSNLRGTIESAWAASSGR